MTRKSGRERRPSEKGAVFKQTQQKVAHARESKAKSSKAKSTHSGSNGKKRKLSSASEGSVEDSEPHRNKENNHTSRQKSQKKCLRSEKDAFEIVDGSDEAEVSLQSRPGSEGGSDNGSTDELGEVRLIKMNSISFYDSEQEAGPTDHHHVALPSQLNTKKQQADDMLTIFSDRCTVKFTYDDGTSETLIGRWCSVCESVIYHYSLAL